jgi:hypothetical protein
MTPREGVPRLAPIRRDDVAEVAAFLNANLNSRVSAEKWSAMIVPPWLCDAPNHGFLLRADDELVGVHLAFYSTRQVQGRAQQFCNLGAWCVLEPHRAQGLRLLRALLAQRGFTFTDLSPSGNVIEVNRRLRFTELDTATALVPNLPWPLVSRRAQVSDDPALLRRTLTGLDRDIHADHVKSIAVRHLLLQADGEHCYLMVRRDRRHGLPLFATVLYVGNRTLFARHGRVVFRHLLRGGALATLAELRVVGSRPSNSRMLATPRPKMFLSAGLASEDIDYVYSELSCVAW